MAPSVTSKDTSGPPGGGGCFTPPLFGVGHAARRTRANAQATRTIAEIVSRSAAARAFAAASVFAARAFAAGWLGAELGRAQAVPADVRVADDRDDERVVQAD